MAADVTCVKYALINDKSISEINLFDHSPLLLSINFASPLSDVKSSKAIGLSRHLCVAWKKTANDDIVK